MKQSRALEIWVGVFVAAGVGALFVLALKVSNLTTFANPEGYEVTARFENSGGLKVRSPVTMGGVRIGRVSAISYDMDRYESVVTLTIDPTYDKIPQDTTASIYTSGLLGEQYVGLEPGGEVKYLKNGDEIEYTQSALILEKMIGQFLYQTAEGEKR